MVWTALAKRDPHLRRARSCSLSRRWTIAVDQAGADDGVMGARRPMGLFDCTRLARRLGLAIAAAACAHAWPAVAQTSVKFSLDGKFEGPSALFLLPLDKGYYKAAGLDVTIDEATTAQEPIARVASGNYDMAF